MSLRKKAFYCLMRGLIVGILLGLLLYMLTIPVPENAGVWTAEAWQQYVEEHYNK